MDMEKHPAFTLMCDDLVHFMEHDPELADGIKWVDQQAFKKGCSFYEMVFEIMYKHDVNGKAREWLRSKDET